MRPIDWLDLPSLPPLYRMLSEQFLDGPAPVGVGRRGRGSTGGTFRESLAGADVVASDYFNLSCVDGGGSWGVLATANMGAIAVPAELVTAAILPSLPKDLGRIAIRVGPADDRLRRALLFARRRPENAALQAAVVSAGLEHAALHERLRVWRPAVAA